MSGVLQRRMSICIVDLLAIDRCVKDRGNDLELVNAIVFVTSINGHLLHKQVLGVTPVLLSCHASRLVGTLPDEDVAIGSAFCRLASHPLVLSTSNEVDPAVA